MRCKVVKEHSLIAPKDMKDGDIGIIKTSYFGPNAIGAIVQSHGSRLIWLGQPSSESWPSGALTESQCICVLTGIFTLEFDYGST